MLHWFFKHTNVHQSVFNDSWSSTMKMEWSFKKISNWINSFDWSNRKVIMCTWWKGFGNTIVVFVSSFVIKSTQLQNMKLFVSKQTNRNRVIKVEVIGVIYKIAWTTKIPHTMFFQTIIKAKWLVEIVTHAPFELWNYHIDVDLI